MKKPANGAIYAGFIIAILLQQCRAGILPLTREEALQRLQVERKDEKEYAPQNYQIRTT